MFYRCAASRFFCLGIVSFLIAAGVSCREEPVASATVLDFEVVAEYPHDSLAFTQGLCFSGGHLFESTGRKGESSLRQVDFATGKSIRSAELPDRYFGEGITAHGGKLYQLTWDAGLGFVYDAATLEKLGTFSYPGEGWGLTSDGTHLIVSDGTPVLRFYNPDQFVQEKSLQIRDDRGPVAQLNELEWIDGYLYANLWHTDFIVKIDPRNGHVVGRLHLGSLLQPRPLDPEAVLNGIAHDPTTGLVYVTGKLWPRIYALRLLE
jgi:glutaminyl-peptide cyclotransferase